MHKKKIETVEQWMRSCSNVSQVRRLFFYCLIFYNFSTWTFGTLLWYQFETKLSSCFHFSSQNQNILGDIFTCLRKNCLHWQKKWLKVFCGSELIPSVTCRAASYCCQDLPAVERLPQFGCCLGNLAFRSSSGQTPLPLSLLTVISTVGNELKCISFYSDSIGY